MSLTSHVVSAQDELVVKAEAVDVSESSPAPSTEQTEFFESKIRPLLVEKCARCHSDQAGITHGGLALDTYQGWKRGSDSGQAIVPFNSADSLLLEAVEYRNDSLQMPPPDDGGRLNDSEIANLKIWIESGAADPRIETVKRGGLTEDEIHHWWSFLPIRSEAISGVQGSSEGIDELVDLELAKQGIAPVANADRRTLLRRASFDLTGLPPTIEQVRDFEQDTSQDAWGKVIERLLASPHYGERWGRHWLDVVRYADTAGDNTDHPIQDMWRYRNWVIQAFNSNMPYNQFVREQLAGDLIHDKADAKLREQGIVATGFLALARRFDHDIDTTTHLMLEDAIDVVGKSFLGLTVACARCHDHKYDPITAADYYALYGILNSSRFSFPGCEAKQLPRDLIPLQTDAQWLEKTKPIQDELAELAIQLQNLQSSTEPIIPPKAEHVLLSDSVVPEGDARELGNEAKSPLRTKVQQGDLIVLDIAPDDNYGGDTTRVDWTIKSVDGSSEVWDLSQDLHRSKVYSNPSPSVRSDDPVWLFLDGRSTVSLLSEYVDRISGIEGLVGWRTGDNPAVFINTTDYPIKAWTELPPKQVFVHPAPDGSVAIGWVSPISGEIEIYGQVADQHPGGPNGVHFQLKHFKGDHRPSLGLNIAKAKERQLLEQQMKQVRSRMPARPVAYGVVDGKVGDAPLQLRGDPEKPGNIVQRAWIKRLGGQTLLVPERSGREELADWIVDSQNPLTARVMVNRIWQYHFGKGLVATSNDFGTRGEKPSHPALLDWLARKFIESGWDIKQMHRLIMQTAAYRRASLPNESDAYQVGLEKDPNNKWLGRFSRRRLSAEELRDSLLLHSGLLDYSPAEAHPIPDASGWSYSQHVPFISTFPSNRRSVYQMTLRNRREPYMGLFDGADPNSSTAVRQVSTVPTQSLYFLNDPQFHERGKHSLRKVLEKSTDSLSFSTTEAQQTDITSEGIAFRRTLILELARHFWQRELSRKECEAMDAFLLNYPVQASPILEKQVSEAEGQIPDAQVWHKLAANSQVSAQAWQSLARIFLSSNEYLFVD